MRWPGYRVVLLTVVLGAFAATAVFAQSGNRPQPRKLKPGWTQLFNGKDFTNWRKVGAEKWEVDENGAILGQGITDKYGYLATEKSYRDFHL